MQMRAVVELAITCVGCNVGHQFRQACGLYVVQAKLLETWRVNDRRAACCVRPIQRSAGGGVFAGIECRRDDIGQHLGIRHHPVDERAFTRARGA